MGHHRARDGDEPQDLSVEEVRSTLRDAADAYRPDRTAMVNRVASGRAASMPAGGARRTLFRMNPIAAALAVAFILVASISAARLTSGPDRTVAADRPAVSVPAVAGTGTSAATGTGSSAPSSPAGAVPPGTTGAAPSSSNPPAGPTRNGPSATATLNPQTTPNGFLTSGGALDPNSSPMWSQNNVTLTNSKPIVQLTVTITVALTPGVTEHGRFTTAPNDDMVMSVTRSPTALVYTYVLKDGKKLVPGDYKFAAQFAHKPGRDNTDSYVVAAGTTGAVAELTGAFVR